MVSYLGMPWYAIIEEQGTDSKVGIVCLAQDQCTLGHGRFILATAVGTMGITLAY